jgi:hypothetical protein
MDDSLIKSPITRVVILALAFVLFSISAYMVYAVLRNKPLADPNDPKNFIANLPFWSKDLHKVKLMVIGSIGSAFFFWYIIQYLKLWLSE